MSSLVTLRGNPISVACVCCRSLVISAELWRLLISTLKMRPVSDRLNPSQIRQVSFQCGCQIRQASFSSNVTTHTQLVNFIFTLGTSACLVALESCSESFGGEARQVQPHVGVRPNKIDLTLGGDPTCWGQTQQVETGSPCQNPT